MAEEKAIRSKIILGGVEEFRENLRLAKEDVKEFNDSLQSANNSIEQLTKNMKEFSKLFGQAESYSDEITTSILQ